VRREALGVPCAVCRVPCAPFARCPRDNNNAGAFQTNETSVEALESGPSGLGQLRIEQQGLSK
jgi:hypothetical protein